jgi:nitric oxide reductase subunit B
LVGDGSYMAPDWTADWLHRESVFILDQCASQSGAEGWQQRLVARQSLRLT